MKKIGLTVLVMMLCLTKSFCNEPEQSSKKTIVVERSVFAELVKAAEIGKLSSKAVGSFESERRVLRDSLEAVKAEKVILQQKVNKDEETILLLHIGLVLFLAIIILLIWLYTKR